MIDRNTGRPLSDFEHLKQSIITILETPIGSRVYRREFGSELFRLIDEPMNKSLMIDVYAAIASALAQWEKRFQLQNIQAKQSESGKITVTLRGIYLVNGEQITFDGLIIS